MNLDKRDLDRYLTTEPERDFCNHEWGICPPSVDAEHGFPGEPHLCYFERGHHQAHTCGTCDAEHPLSPDEVSSLEEPFRG